MEHTPCVGCGVRLPTEDGPTHPYLESSPACWRVYGEVLTREYQDPRYLRLHRLTVDAYAVQHPGRPSPQTIQSLAVHLVSLCCVLEEDWPPDRVTRLLGRVTDAPIRWLTPPEDRGAITIAAVHAVSTPEEHLARVQAWASSTWDAWAHYHPTIRRWSHAVRTPRRR